MSHDEGDRMMLEWKEFKAVISGKVPVRATIVLIFIVILIVTLDWLL